MVALDVRGSAVKLEEKQSQLEVKDGGHVDQLKLKNEGNILESDAASSEKVQSNTRDGVSKNFIGGPSSWYMSAYPKTNGFLSFFV